MREPSRPPRKGADHRDARVLSMLEAEVGLTKDEAEYYLRLLKEGSAPAKVSANLSGELSRRGMAILSGDGRQIIPVHPRLGLSNHYRTWREEMVREINERRMRMDRLILEVIPIYEGATEKRPEREGV